MGREKWAHRAARNSRELVKHIQHASDVARLKAGFDLEAEGHANPRDTIPSSEEIVLFFPPKK